MFVREFMTRRPITVHPTLDLPDAYHLMKAHGIRHLPVVTHNRVCGILSERDLKAVGPRTSDNTDPWDMAYAMMRMTVHDVMQRKVETVLADARMESAAWTMARRKIGCLPVVDTDNCVVGIITQVDVMRAMAQLMGAAEGRIQVTLPDEEASRQRLADVLPHSMLSSIVFSKDPAEIVLAFECGTDPRTMQKLLDFLSDVGLSVAGWRDMQGNDAAVEGASLDSLLAALPVP